jgi:hypothetical protein
MIMDPVFLKKTYGKGLVFFEGIDVQQLLPGGSPQLIKQKNGWKKLLKV